MLAAAIVATGSIGCLGGEQPVAGATESGAVAGSVEPLPAFCGPEIRTPHSRERFDIKNAVISEKLNTALLPAMREL